MFVGWDSSPWPWEGFGKGRTNPTELHLAFLNADLGELTVQTLPLVKGEPQAMELMRMGLAACLAAGELRVLFPADPPAPARLPEYASDERRFAVLAESQVATLQRHVERALYLSSTGHLSLGGR